MVNKEELNKFYIQELETSIISYLAEIQNINYREAMSLY